MRTLVYVPILHQFDVDCGAGTTHRQRAIIAAAAEHFWTGIEKGLSRRRFQRAYQDSFWQNDFASFRKAFKGRSYNYEYLNRLVTQGVFLETTEDPELLIEHLDAFERGEEDPEARERRDNYVAWRVHATLRPGEVGVLFMGVDHCVDSRLRKFPDLAVELYLGPLHQYNAAYLALYPSLPRDVPRFITRMKQDAKINLS